MIWIVAIAMLLSLPLAEYLIKKKGFSIPRAFTAALLACWAAVALISLIVNWLDA